jgi:hypothetical protein
MVSSNKISHMAIFVANNSKNDQLRNLIKEKSYWNLPNHRSSNNNQATATTEATPTTKTVTTAATTTATTTTTAFWHPKPGTCTRAAP